MPTLSIIIPTRERAEYLEAALKSAVSVKSNKIEILVSDNMSMDHTRDVVGAATDPRIRYVNTGRRVSMRQNYEFAVSHAEGDYYLIIGDDDAVIPTAIPPLIDVLEKESPTLVWWSPPLYEWPGDGPRSNPHVLITRNMLFGGYETKQTAPLVSAMCGGTLKTQRIMPSIYHGCASRVLMEEIKQKGGQYFGAQNPDCYVSFAGCLLTNSFIQLSHPASIAGASPKSNAGSKESQAVFIQETEKDPVVEPLDMSSLVVPVYYLSTLIAARLVLPTAPPIDWEQWLQRAVIDIRAAYPAGDVRQGHLDRLTKSLVPYGRSLPEVTVDSQNKLKKKRKNRGRLPSFGRVRVAFDQNSTVLDAVDFIDRGSSGYALQKASIVERNMRWLSTLMRGNARSKSRL